MVECIAHKGQGCRRRACPVWDLSLQVVRLDPEAALEAIKRAVALTLKHPERPVGICGLIWDLQHGIPWNLADEPA